MKKTSLSSLLILFMFYAFAGGPWLLPKKGGFLQFQTVLPAGTYTELYNKSGDKFPINREVLDLNFSVYGEYGLSEKTDLILNLPIKYVKTGATQNALSSASTLESGSLFGLSNVQVSLKHQVLNGDWKAAVSVSGKINTVSTDLEKGLATGYSANALGLFFHIGKSFGDRIYSFTEAGYYVASNNFSNYYDLHYELGWKAKENKSLWAIFTLDARISERNGKFLNYNLLQTGLYPNDQEWLPAFGIKGVYETEKNIGYVISVNSVVKANLVGAALPIGLSVYKKW